MPQKSNAHYRQQNDPYLSQPIRRHPIFRTTGLDFVPHPVNYESAACCTLPSRGRLILWRFPADWRSISRVVGYAWLSDAERNRAKHYRNPALAKRYLVARATLRLILARMFNCEPGAIVLMDKADGLLYLMRPEPRTKVCIDLAYAGIWVIIGLSITDLGISTVLPVPTASPAEIADAMQFRTAASALPQDFFPGTNGDSQRWQARHASLSRLASLGALASGPTVLAEYGAAAIVRTSTEQRCHVLELPMPGKIAAAVALPQLITRVDAFGWNKD